MATAATGVDVNAARVGEQRKIELRKVQAFMLSKSKTRAETISDQAQSDFFI